MSSLREQIAEELGTDDITAIAKAAIKRAEQADAEAKEANGAYWREREKTEAMRHAKDTEIERLREAIGERCPSCDHLATHHQDDGCWYTVSIGTPGRDSVCPCSAALDQPEET